MTQKFRPSRPCGLWCMMLGLVYDVVFAERWQPLVKLAIIAVGVAVGVWWLRL